MSKSSTKNGDITSGKNGEWMRKNGVVGAIDPSTSSTLYQNGTATNTVVESHGGQPVTTGNYWQQRYRQSALYQHHQQISSSTTYSSNSIDRPLTVDSTVSRRFVDKNVPKPIKS